MRWTSSKEKSADAIAGKISLRGRRDVNIAREPVAELLAAEMI
jgi:hypothetical protein